MSHAILCNIFTTGRDYDGEIYCSIPTQYADSMLSMSRGLPVEDSAKKHRSGQHCWE